LLSGAAAAVPPTPPPLFAGAPAKPAKIYTHACTPHIKIFFFFFAMSDDGRDVKCYIGMK
jgi:hypothetical protein